MSKSDRTGGSAVAIETDHGIASMKRIAAACLVGTTIELYDFHIYGTAAALVFPRVFFPHLSPAMATTASMGTLSQYFCPGRWVLWFLGISEISWAAKRP
jgi:hypothetical protein